MRLRFISSNVYKIAEAREILEIKGVEVIPVATKIDEIQTVDTEKLVRDKCVKAFKEIGRPLFVEHTGLELATLNGFPGGLTQTFWDTLEADRFAALFGTAGDTSVVARTRIGYCDGVKIYQFEGSVRGFVPPEPRGDRKFQWDCVFVPEGDHQTFAEMGNRKNEISMRRKALDSFAEHLGTEDAK